MHVATLPTYEDMWVHPMVVAALSDGMYTYSCAEPWDPTVTYQPGDLVLAGDCPFGGCVYSAVQSSLGVDPATDTSGAWALDEAASLERLKLMTATTQATWLLDTLTGYRLHGQECWREDYQVHTCTITLRRQPVAAIRSVVHIKRCNQPSGEVPNWCWKAQNQISVCCDGCGYIDFSCGCDDNVVRVDYEIASNLPPGTEGLVAWLAAEYGKAAAGKPCALPERITNVTRQGVSWTILDPQEFLDKGYTGMSRVDQWLVPTKMTLGGTYIDPLTSTRLFSGRLNDCGPDPDPIPIPPGPSGPTGPTGPAAPYGGGPYGSGPYGGTP